MSWRLSPNPVLPYSEPRSSLLRSPLPPFLLTYPVLPYPRSRLLTPFSLTPVLAYLLRSPLPPFSLTYPGPAYPVPAYPVLPYPVLPYPVLPYPVLPLLAERKTGHEVSLRPPYPVLPHPVLPYPRFPLPRSPLHPFSHTPFSLTPFSRTPFSPCWLRGRRGGALNQHQLKPTCYWPKNLTPFPR